MAIGDDMVGGASVSSVIRSGGRDQGTTGLGGEAGAVGVTRQAIDAIELAVDELRGPKPESSIGASNAGAGFGAREAGPVLAPRAEAPYRWAGKQPNGRVRVEARACVANEETDGPTVANLGMKTWI